MAKPLTPAQAQQVRTAVADAENGRATLEQLAAAHAICEGAMATKTLGVLRMHIHRMTPQPLHHTAGKSILLGMISGSMVWFLLARHR